MQDCECTLENGKATKLYKTKTLLCDHNRASMVMPGLVKLWSPKNPLGPHQVLAGSNIRYIITCTSCGTEASKQVCNLRQLSNGYICSKCKIKHLLIPDILPICDCIKSLNYTTHNGEYVCVHNNLLSMIPNILDYWHSSNNISPDKLPRRAFGTATLSCINGHLRTIKYSDLVGMKTYSCKKCKFADTIAGKLYPHLIPEVNDGTDLMAYSYGSRYNVEWKCLKENCRHIWNVSIQCRTLYRSGCPKCAGNAAHTYQTFLDKAKSIHGTAYIYPDNVENFNLQIYIDIVCPIPNHGIFNQMAHHHLMPRGCPACGKESKGEKLIAATLSEMGIEFERQKKYPTLKNIGLLAYDFYIPKWNALIEFDGLQHFIVTNWNTEKQTLLLSMQKDLTKDKFAVENGLRLVRISCLQIKLIPQILSNLQEVVKTHGLFIATYDHYAANIPNTGTHSYFPVECPPIDWSTVK